MAGTKEIADCPGYYVGSDGVVVGRYGRPLKPLLGNHGYMVVGCRHRTDGYKTFLVHRLVAAAFVANPLAKTQVNHINFDRADNRAANLEWVSPQENSDHSVSCGRTCAGEAVVGSRLSSWDAWRILQWVSGGLTDSEIASILGVCRETVGHVRRGSTWNHLTGIGG